PAQAICGRAGHTCSAYEAARAGECAVEEAGGRARPRDRGDEGGQPKKVVTAPMRRRQVAYGMKRGLSQRRACRLFSVARSALQYQSKLSVKDAPALVAMRRLAREYPRFGYRRIAILLRREGFPMSFDRAWRLWRTAKLQVPKKRRRRRPASSRPRPRAPGQRHHVWAYDFVFDRCANGQVLKCLT